MKRRLLYLAPVVLVLFSIAATFISVPSAYAKAPEFAFDYDTNPDVVTTISKVAGQTSGGIDFSDNTGAFNKTQVLARGGIFGDGKVLSYARHVPDKGYQYTYNYYCSGGKALTTPPDNSKEIYEIEASVILDLRDHFNKDKYEQYNAVITHINYSPAKAENQIATGGWELGAEDGIDAFDYVKQKPKMPASCVAEGFQFKHSGYTKPGAVVLPQASDAVKKSWEATAKAAGATAPKDLSGGTTGGGSGSGVNSPDCNSGGDPLNWILCPIFDGVAAFSDFMFNQVVLPLLHTTPISTDPSSSSYQTWSSFRIYGNIFLVIALLVVVFGQSIGGGIIDAYTAKKVLPRLLVSVILINLSIYIVALMVDITNIFGGTIGAAMTQPLKDQGAFQITPSGVQAGTIVAGGAAATIGGTIITIGSLLTKASFLADMFSFMLLFVVMPVVLGMLAAFVTLVMRQAIIIALVLISPVAFALYCLPNTEKYFRKWWDFLLQTLMVYPIVIIFFAVADILSVTVYQTGSNNPLAALISFVLQFLPLLLIPFAFKLAGGAVGRIHDAISSVSKRSQEAYKGNANDPRSRRNIARARLSNAMIASRSNKLNELRESTKGPLDTSKRFAATRRKAQLARAGLVNFGYNDVDRLRQTQNELFDKDISSKVAAGNDAVERAFFAQKWKGTDGQEVKDDDGNVVQRLRQGAYYSTYRNSEGEYSESSPVDVTKAHKMYDGNESQIQTLIKYESGKIANDGDFYGRDNTGAPIYEPERIMSDIDKEKMPLGSFMSNLPTVMSDAKLSQSSAFGASVGSFFSIQGQRKEMKHVKLGKDGNSWQQDKHAYVQDFAENIASYGAATGKTSPIKRLTSIENELQAARASGRPFTPVEQRSWEDLQKAANGLDTRLSRGEFVAPTGAEGAAQPTGGAGGTSGGPARVNDAIQEFIRTVGQRAP